MYVAIGGVCHFFGDGMSTMAKPTRCSMSRRTVTDDTLEECVDNDETTLVMSNEHSSSVAVTKEQERLLEACPEATLDECARFAGAWKDWEQARSNLQAYLEWKRSHGLDDSNDSPCPALADGEDPNQFDTHLWSLAMEKACEFRQQQASDSLTKTDPSNTIRPPILVAPVRRHDHSPVTCRHGHRLIAVWPARLPLSALQNELHTYTTCLALYLYYTLLAPMTSTEDDSSKQDSTTRTTATAPKVTILVDCRAGRNWPNVPVYKMYGFVQRVCQSLRRLFPGLVHRVIVAPIPTVACWAYKMIAPLLDPDLRRHVQLVAGPSTSCTAVLPLSLQSMIAPSDLELLESLRQTAVTASN
jgi:CRAL/TRIO domain